jgi:hypothetical protein
MPERSDKPPRYGQQLAPPRPNKPHLDPLMMIRHLRTLTVECKQCNERWTFMMTDLMKFFGPEYKIYYLRYDMIICPKRLDVKECMVRYVNEEGVDTRVDEKDGGPVAE